MRIGPDRAHSTAPCESLGHTRVSRQPEPAGPIASFDVLQLVDKKVSLPVGGIAAVFL